jgi:neutral ceramidase
MVQGTEIPEGPMPSDITGSTVDLTNKVVLDDKPLRKSFGSVITEPEAGYRLGDTVTVQFWGAHPNNNYRIQDSFLVVEKLVNGTYQPVAYDWDPETTYEWQRSGIANSKITITWNTMGASAGTYRIRHKGDHKSGWTGAITSYEGVSREFSVGL